MRAQRLDRARFRPVAGRNQAFARRRRAANPAFDEIVGGHSRRRPHHRKTHPSARTTDFQFRPAAVEYHRDPNTLVVVNCR